MTMTELVRRRMAEPHTQVSPSRRACLLGVWSLVLTSLLPSTHASGEPLPVHVPRMATVGQASLSVGERIDAGRTGGVASLPARPRLRWRTSVSQRIDHPLAVTADGALVIVTSLAGAYAGEAAVLELSPETGSIRSTTKIEPSASGVALLNGGLRVLVSVRGDALGFTAAGRIAFRTSLSADPGSAPRVGLVPLPHGGFAVARRSELFELDAHGAVVGSVRLELTPAIAARPDGEIIGVTPNGEVFGWRAGSAPRAYGSFGEHTIVAVGGHLCPGGPTVDSRMVAGRRRDRVLCVAEGFVDELDLSIRRRRTLLGRGALPFRTPVAVSSAGEMVVVAAGGTLIRLGGVNELALSDVLGGGAAPGSHDAGVYLPPAAEVAPLLARDGSVVFGAAEGIALGYASGAVQQLTRCAGAGTVAGVAPGPMGSIYVACADGKVELWIDSA